VGKENQLKSVPQKEPILLVILHKKTMNERYQVNGSEDHSSILSIIICAICSFFWSNDLQKNLSKPFIVINRTLNNVLDQLSNANINKSATFARNHKGNCAVLCLKRDLLAGGRVILIHFCIRCGLFCAKS
jgi:hypothetical protein